MSEKDNINVDHSYNSESAKHQTVIKDTIENRAWSGEGTTQSQASTEATRKFLSDRRVREYMS